MNTTRFFAIGFALLSITAIARAEISLTEALDAPEAVTWQTSDEHPFMGGLDSGAKNGSSAQVGILPGEETWLEATVTGPGLFDFWLRDVPGASNNPRDLEWELFVDGVKSRINVWGPTWPAQWVLGSGVHTVRLVFRNDTGVDERAFIAVDDVSWHPLVLASGGEGWTASHPEMADGFEAGGFENGPQHVIPVATGEERWIEKTVTGPGVLAWNARLTTGLYPDFRRQVLVNGVGVLPLEQHSSWETNRLHVPEGVHAIRWTSEPVFYGEEPYQVHTDAIWQISNVVFTPGVLPLMQGIDDEEMIWLEVGGAEGNLVGGEGAFDGEDAWSLGDGTVLYLCNATDQGIKARSMARWREVESGQPTWTPAFRWAGPGETVEWASLRGYESAVYAAPYWVDQFTMERIDLLPLREAVDAESELTVNGWIGLAEADEAFDGVDVGWSLLTRRHGLNTAAMTLEGPAKMRFRWRSSGTGTLGLRVDGGWLPVASPGLDWQEVEFDVQHAASVEWVHAPAPETSYDAPGEAWLDAITIEGLPPRMIDAIVGAGTGLVFEGPWQAVGYRDAAGVWREGARGIAEGAGLRTTVTGPMLVSFRTYCAGLAIPPSAEDGPAAQSVVIVDPGGGIIPAQRFLSVAVGGSEKLRIMQEAGDGWREHWVRVPEGEHQLSWQLDHAKALGFPSEAMPPWQAWVTDVRLMTPEHHYEAWADQFFGDSAAREPGDDADGDGVSNFMEYAYGSDPGDGSSRPPKMFGAMGPTRFFFINGQLHDKKTYALHVPRLPGHIEAVLETSTDLVTWTPSPIPLRSFLSLGSGFLLPPADPPDSDSGIYQVIQFAIDPDQPAKFFRIVFEP